MPEIIRGPVLWCAVLVGAAFSAFAGEEWYLSNASGIALEKAPSKLRALHGEWALSVEQGGAGTLPGILKPYYDNSYSVEVRVLYQNRNPLRRQWVFRDEKGVTRLNASFPEAAKMDADRLPFIELYGGDRLLVEFHEIVSEEKRFITRYSYNGGLLCRAETGFDGEVLWSDVYKYTRNFKLRGVERAYMPAALVASLLPEEAGTSPDRKSFVFPPPGAFIHPESPYDYSLRTGALRDVFGIQPVRILYNTDDQGRMLSEQWLDGEGETLAELSNDWSNDRITLITWKAGKNSGTVEFEYSASGGRISERAFRNGVLERSITKSGNRETEELFMAGRVILRSVWENGRKISEERL